jgi:hypothetical protein
MKIYVVVLALCAASTVYGKTSSFIAPTFLILILILTLLRVVGVEMNSSQSCLYLTDLTDSRQLINPARKWVLGVSGTFNLTL